MTVSIQFDTVADSISNLSISGVTIRDFDSLSASWLPLPKVMFPNPDGPITNITLTRESFGSGSSAKFTLSYTLNYRYLHVPLGDMATFGAAFSGLIDNIVLICNAMVTNDDPSADSVVDVTLEGISDIAPLPDPAGNMYYGADIAVRVTEFLN